MNKKISVGFAISLALMLSTISITLTLIFSMRHFNNLVRGVKEREAVYTKFTEIDNKIRQNYIGEIDEKVLNDYVANGLVSGIRDKYSEYYTSTQYKAFLDSQKGETVGVGIEVYDDPSGYIKVTSVNEGSSAEENGIKPGDIIKKIDGKDIININFDDSVKLLKGEPNTKVTVTIQRDVKEIEVSLTRKNLVINTVISSKQGDFAYVRIKSFNEKTPEQFISVVENFISQGIKGLILDVRNNGGGLLTSVVKVLDYLLPEGDIVSAMYKDGKKEVLYKSDKQEVKLPMVVMGNGSTASAAELFVSALRDYKKAIFVGTTTYGKGVMQDIFPLSDGSALKLTIAKYYPPTSDNYDGVGIKPDFDVSLNKDQESSIYNGNLNNDIQFQKSVEILKSK